MAVSLAAEAEAAKRIAIIGDAVNTALVQLDAAAVEMGDANASYWEDCCPECAMQLSIARDSITVARDALRNLA